ncbi:unnamed protein product [Phaedon cochleariae]|uniref:Uncharacterized protein n=1 Tax=Phaedon cochleariae TaxID=80249 RepID=A0A9P0GUG7_PHACE|nr:unnamed protein product [Phaedon cochleariae]
MESEDEFLYTYFNHVSQLCYEKAKEHIEKEREPKVTTSPWSLFLNILQQLALAEKSYIEIGFLQNKHKSFLRKDNSLRSVYESMKNDLKKLEDNCKQTIADKRIQKGSKNIIEFMNARINLIDLYEKIHNISLNKQLICYNEIVHQVESVIEKNSGGFTDISMTPAKAVFSLECEILDQLFKALTELQRLQFLPSLALIHGAHTRLAAWENKIQSRETWKLGNMFKGNPLPALFQWLQQLKGAVLSKFSLYFYHTLAHQTTPNEMRNLCSKLHHDHFQKILAFQRRYDVSSVILLSDTQVSSDTTNNRFPVIVAFPSRNPPQLDTILKMISETNNELMNVEKIIYKFSSQEQFTYVLTTVEPNIYLVILFESKKSEKDTFISNFVVELCQNMRCTKIFSSLKSMTK